MRRMMCELFFWKPTWKGAWLDIMWKKWDGTYFNFQRIGFCVRFKSRRVDDTE